MGHGTDAANTAIHRRVAACRAATDPACIARMRSGWAVMGDPQVLHGYCLLLPDPVVPHLNALPPAAQAEFLADMAAIGTAVQRLTGAIRINYALFGNVEPALHAHVLPRYAHEPEALRTANPWGYDWAAARRFDPAADGGLLLRLRELLEPRPAGPDARRGTRALHHVDLTASDLERSTRFYDAVLPLLGFVRTADAEEGPIWRKDGFELGLQAARAQGRAHTHSRWEPGLHHLAFAAESRDSVDALHRELLRLGVLVLDAPTTYERYGPGYYAVFFADPDGLKLEYVFAP